MLCKYWAGVTLVFGMVTMKFDMSRLDMIGVFIPVKFI